MSKIGKEVLSLEEQAQELGFECLGDALRVGCETEYKDGGLVLVEPLELAHRAWEKEKKKVLEGLNSCLATSECSPACDIDIERAIKFIEEAHE